MTKGYKLRNLDVNIKKVDRYTENGVCHLNANDKCWSSPALFIFISIGWEISNNTIHFCLLYLHSPCLPINLHFYLFFVLLYWLRGGDRNKVTIPMTLVLSYFFYIFADTIGLPPPTLVSTSLSASKVCFGTRGYYISPGAWDEYSVVAAPGSIL